MPETIVRVLDESDGGLSPVNQSRLDALCVALGREPVSEVTAAMLKDGTLPPEVFAIFREPLTEVFGAVREMMKAAEHVRDTPAVFEGLLAAARQKLMGWFIANRANLMRVDSLSADMVGSLEHLAAILQARELKDIESRDLVKGMALSADLERGILRIFEEMVRRLCVHINDVYEYGKVEMGTVTPRHHFDSLTVQFQMGHGEREGDPDNKELISLAGNFFREAGLNNARVSSHPTEGITVEFKLGRPENKRQ